MTNKELQNLLKDYPDDMPVRLLYDHTSYSKEKNNIIEFTEENVLRTSETVYVDDDAPEDEWDNEDGKIELGDGLQYLLFNPIIL